MPLFLDTINPILPVQGAVDTAIQLLTPTTGALERFFVFTMQAPCLTAFTLQGSGSDVTIGCSDQVPR